MTSLNELHDLYNELTNPQFQDNKHNFQVILLI